MQALRNHRLEAYATGGQSVRDRAIFLSDSLFWFGVMVDFVGNSRGIAFGWKVQWSSVVGWAGKGIARG